jgi:hypothetical protein
VVRGNGFRIGYARGRDWKPSRSSTSQASSDPDPYLRVFIEHDGKQFFGDFRADDRRIVRRVYEVLVNRIGAPLAGMGDLAVGD